MKKKTLIEIQKRRMRGENVRGAKIHRLSTETKLLLNRMYWLEYWLQELTGAIREVGKNKK